MLRIVKNNFLGGNRPRLPLVFLNLAFNHKRKEALIRLNEVIFIMICKKEFELELKLHINKRLYERGVLTEEMYTRAKKIILEG